MVLFHLIVKSIFKTTKSNDWSWSIKIFPAEIAITNASVEK